MSDYPADLPTGSDPRRYVDKVRLVVKQTPSIYGGSAAVTGGFVCNWGEIDVDLIEAAQLSTAVALDPRTSTYEPYSAQQSYTQHEWGASGYGVTFLIDLAESVSADLVVAGMAYAVHRIRGSKQRPRDWSLGDDIHGAREDAVCAIVDIFGEEADELAVDESSVTRGTAQIRVTGAHGTYTATLSALETGDPFIHVVKQKG